MTVVCARVIVVVLLIVVVVVVVVVVVAVVQQLPSLLFVAAALSSFCFPFANHRQAVTTITTALAARKHAITIANKQQQQQH